MNKYNDSYKNDRYKLDVACTNCEYSGTVDIKRGSLLTQRACPSCGCATLRKIGSLAL